MASTATKPLCVTCNKRAGIAICPGCEHRFCNTHWTEHRQTLSHRMDKIVQDRDVLKQDLYRDEGAHPLLSRVDQWENQSIQTIQSAADQARNDIRQWIQETKVSLGKSMENLTQELQASRGEDEFTEIDLKRLEERLAELRRMLQNPSAVNIEDNRQKPPLHLIKFTRKSTGTTSSIALDNYRSE